MLQNKQSCCVPAELLHTSVTRLKERELDWEQEQEQEQVQKQEQEQEEMRGAVVGKQRQQAGAGQRLS